MRLTDIESIRETLASLEATSAFDLTIRDGTEMIRVRRNGRDAGPLAVSVKSSSSGAFLRTVSDPTFVLPEVGSTVRARQILAFTEHDGVRRAVRAPIDGQLFQERAEHGSKVVAGQTVLTVRPNDPSQGEPG